jgi:arylformamidase
VATLIDVSHIVEHGMITYKGLPAPTISDHLSRIESQSRYAEGTEFQIGKIEMVANTGTYIDSPFHRYAKGKDLSDLPLPTIANLDGLVVRHLKRNKRAIDADVFTGLTLKNRAVLVHTGWDEHWRTDQYAEGHPYLTRAAAQFLVDQGAVLVGIDSFNIDDAADGTRPAHTLLLGAEIPIVEHLCNLESLPDEGFAFFAVPVKIKGFGSFPVRAFAILSQNKESQRNYFP